MSDFIRAHQLHDRWPVFSRGAWHNLLASGEVPSTKIGRARVVRVTDVERFLSGEAQRPSTNATEQASTSPTLMRAPIASGG